MPEVANGGDHDWVDTNSDAEVHDKAYLAKSVFDAEEDAIKKRREQIKIQPINPRNRDGCPDTGLALSGGGIRSASFGLGALQAFHAYSGIEGVDYLSTVSGGGYIGCSLTTAMQKSSGEFPFNNPGQYDDTDAVRHIRDYSNYLVPHGILDFITALGLIGRGLVANILIVLPVLFLCVSITLMIHPSRDLLGEPVGAIQYILDTFPSLPLLGSLHAYWFTVILLAINLLFLIFWALFTSMNVGKAATFRGGWVTFSKALFLLTVVTAFFETQPFILWLIPHNIKGGATAALPLRGLWTYSPSLTSISGLLGSMAAVFAILSKYLGDVLAAAKRATGWLAWFKKLAALAALFLAGLLVPVLLWLCYLWLVDLGLGHDLAAASYFAAFAGSAFVALFVNPNRTSLYRLYRDRLSKAFLFDPNGKPENRDKNGDLKSFEPPLYDIQPALCPYPVINAALNIEGSQYANKRGRNADFFIFTPEYVGSGATGYVGTRRIKKDSSAAFAVGPRIQQNKNESEKQLAVDIGTAMAISGAAVSANMGASTVKALTFTLAFLNFRLGYWLRNPNPSYTNPPITKRLDWVVARLFWFPSFVLFAEMFSWITEKSPKILLTDGGHIENLGVYSLMKRRCRLIIAIDAEADPTMSFGSFLILERYARIDLGAIIELPWQSIRDCTIEVDKAGQDGSAFPCSQGPHCAAGEIQYGPNETGILLYVKASLSGDEDDYILDYKRRYPAFPHETTSDQFFGEEQLEAYRALGFHIVKGLMTGAVPFAVIPHDSESEEEACQRIRFNISQVLRGKEFAP